MAHCYFAMYKTSECEDLTCYSKAPFVKFYSVIHKMCYNLHGSAFGLDYTVAQRERGRGREKEKVQVSNSHPN